MTLVICGFFVMLRGRVGTDTALTYEPMVQHLSDVEGTEPFFLLILHVLKPIFPSALTTVTVGLGAVLTVLLLVYAWRADRDELFLLQAFLIPTQYLGISVSGQRAGLAFAFLLLALQSLHRQQHWQATALAFAAMFTHYSSIICLFLWWLSAYGIKRRYQWVSLVAGLALAAGVLTLAKDYLFVKLVLYFESGYDRPNPWSGVSVMLLCLLILGALSTSNLLRTDKKRLWVVTIGALLACAAVGLYSIAALRFVGIVELTLIYAVLTIHQKNRIHFNGRLRHCLLCVGLLALVFLVRNVRHELVDPPTSSPILPYRFIWDESVS